MGDMPSGSTTFIIDQFQARLVASVTEESGMSYDGSSFALSNLIK